MASYLGELALSNHLKVFVARTVGSLLISLMKTRDTQSREAALKALNQVSSCEASAKVLVEKGILSPIVMDIFAGPTKPPMRLKEVSATILANIATCDCDFDSIPVGPDNETLVSEYIIHNLLHLISYGGPSIDCKLVQALVGITNSPVTVIPVANAIKSSGATNSLVQFLETPRKDLRMASIQLLHNLSLHISREIGHCLCKSAGQLSSLFEIISENITITEAQVAAIGIIADIPNENVELTRKMLHEDDFHIVVSRTKMIIHGETRRNRFVIPYLEGLVRVLSRITFIFSYEMRAVFFCLNHELAALFTELLQQNGVYKVQIASALALEALSRESKNLSRSPEIRPPNLCLSALLHLSKKPIKTGLCRVHRGACTRGTFCLLEGQSLARLVNLLNHHNEKVVEASLAALSTLLDDGMYIEEGVNVLVEAEGIKPIFNVLVLENQTESLRRRAVWIVERLLRTEEIANEMSGDQNVTNAFVYAFQHGDYETQRIAECALKRIR